MTARGAALEAGDIEAVVTVALLSQWFDGAPRGYLKRNINTNIMQQGVGVDSPTVMIVLSVISWLLVAVITGGWVGSCEFLLQANQHHHLRHHQYQ